MVSKVFTVGKKLTLIMMTITAFFKRIYKSMIFKDLLEIRIVVKNIQGEKVKQIGINL